MKFMSYAHSRLFFGLICFSRLVKPLSRRVIAGAVDALTRRRNGYYSLIFDQVRSPLLIPANGLYTSSLIVRVRVLFRGYRI